MEKEKERIIKILLDVMSKKNNVIDLVAYTKGLSDMYDFLVNKDYKSE